MNRGSELNQFVVTLYEREKENEEERGEEREGDMSVCTSLDGWVDIDLVKIDG